MKISYFTLFALFFSVLTQAQNVRPYLAVVKTTEGKRKGILSFVDSNLLIIKDKHLTKYTYIKFDKINSISLRVIKNPYKFFEIGKKDVNWADDKYENTPNGQRLKPGVEAPTLAESIAEPFAQYLLVGFFNGIVNGIGAPIHAINPSVAKFKNSKKHPLDRQQITELRYFSTNYQINPSYADESLSIKEITKNFKP